jgi:hypothetical protein
MVPLTRGGVTCLAKIYIHRAGISKILFLGLGIILSCDIEWYVWNTQVRYNFSGKKNW